MPRTLITAFIVGMVGIPIGDAQTNDARMIASKRDLPGLLGEAHYIRTLCNGKADQYWREFMRDFLDLEGDSPSRRSIYVRAVNHGYKFQSTRNSTCNSATPKEEILLATKGRQLAERIAIEYLK